MGCPETHKLVVCQLCGIHYYPGINKPCKSEAACNNHFKRWLETEPEVQRLHKDFLNEGPAMNDPCETCLRWPECNGVDAESCPVVRSEKAEED